MYHLSVHEIHALGRWMVYFHCYTCRESITHAKTSIVHGRPKHSACSFIRGAVSGTVASATIAGHMVIGGIGGAVVMTAGATRVAAYSSCGQRVSTIRALRKPRGLMKQRGNTYFASGCHLLGSCLKLLDSVVSSAALQDWRRPVRSFRNHGVHRPRLRTGSSLNRNAALAVNETVSAPTSSIHC